ncbi:GAF and ANTAR domain-containing protein [Cellulosimicrobium marinum]|uniref:GAF and ANTAR domain-containing protein n=1 Tax=Cellulosimicrobium marinum TaxID=1638992 RepID=UPI001E35C322|nr:GAF and ANTAR domain-containing protein [Cellulosimicrobium marinum]MCB7135839.1 GAF and ANTAR domain-containing protein [Cellulosimicrobium marinum]
MDRAGVLSRLAASMAGAESAEPPALRLCRACVEILGARGGAITLAPDESARWTVCASDELAGTLEDLEDVLGEGPGQEAARTGAGVVLRLSDDADGGLAEFVHQARGVAGPTTLYSWPLLPSPGSVGVLTVHQADDVPLALADDERRILADAVGAALLHDTVTVAGAASSWRPRATVHQATGMVVAQLGVSPDDALALLRAHAFADSTTLAELATSVVERRYDFSRADDSPPLGRVRRDHH